MRRYLLCVLAVLSGVTPLAQPVPAAAAPCPDVEVVYARGTDTTPPLDPVGQSFVNALSAQLPGKSVGVYGVNYPATLDLGNSAARGASDAWVRVVNQVAACPATQLVLAGYSQGAGVIDMLTADKPLPWGPNNPMPAAVAKRVAAVAVFGNPARRLAGAPLTQLSKTYGPRTIDLCNAGDPICSTGSDLFAHGKYGDLTAQAAAFVAARVK